MILILLRRLARATLTVLFVFVLVFVAIRMTPGSPAVAMLGQRASAEEIERLERALGWDLPLYQQMWDYLKNAANGNLGISYFLPGRPPVLKELRRLFPATVELSLAAILIAIPLGVGAGIVAAQYRNRWPDRAAIALSSFGVSIPIFFLGIVLLILFPFMPGGGRVDVRLSMKGVEWSGLYVLDTALAGRWDLFTDVLRHLALPAITLASVPTAIIARVTRSSLLEVLGADYIRTARAKGASRTSVLFSHALLGASVPIVSLLGMQLATLLAGAVLTETVFTWPGLGRYIVVAARKPDYNFLQGAVLLLGVVFIFVNLLTDLLCAWLDPRIRLSGGQSR